MTDVAIIPAQQEWVLLQKQCKAFISSGFLPDHITKNTRGAEEAIARAITIAWKGKELGIPPLQAFSSITVISGKPCLSAELMLALCYQRIKGFHANFTTPPDKQHLECTVVMQRQGGQPQTFRYTIEDAQRANLVRQGSPWTKFPASMLRARAISAGARAVCPDAIMGCYTPEEMGGEVLEGEIVEASATAPVEKKEAPPEKIQAAEETQVSEPVKEALSEMREQVSMPRSPTGALSDKQIHRLYAIAHSKGISRDEVHAKLHKAYGFDSTTSLDRSQYNSFCNWMLALEGPSAAHPPAGDSGFAPPDDNIPF